MRLRKQLLIYFGVTAINAVLSFVITSMLTHYIEPADYGRIYLYSSFLNLLTPFITMGILYPLSVEYFKRSHESYSFYFSNAQVIPLISLGIFTILCIVFQNPLSQLLKVSNVWIWAMPLSVWWIMINDTSAMITRNNNKPYQFAFFAVGKNVAEILLTILFVLSLHWSWQGRLGSAAVGPLLLGVISIYCFYRWKLIEKKIDWPLVRRIFLLSFPFIFERLSIFIMNSSDRYFIDSYVQKGTREVGLYGLGGQIAMIIFLVVISMNSAYQPHIFKRMSEGLKHRIHKTTYWYILACAATVGLIFIGIPFLFNFFISGEYAGAKKYAYLLCAGYFMWGIYNAFQAYLLYLQKNREIMLIAILGMVISLSLNFFFVKQYGAEGAAYTSMITYTIMAAASFWLVRKYYLLKHE
ncbi:MAG: oligosaccharide flippase family protein [Chitinophagaceae bacterium]|nr:oligosaccharide flippase family protein [Chitinophagaceae bacterium]